MSAGRGFESMPHASTLASSWPMGQVWSTTSPVAILLAEVPTGAHLLLIGDTHQLPPVGHGSPRALIVAELSYSELTEVHFSMRACEGNRASKANSPPQ